jgi:hypothetical protein
MLRRFNPLLTISTFLILIGTVLIIVSWVQDVTAAGPRPHALWRATVPGIDIGLDTSPADVGRAGYIELWYYPHDAEDIQPVLQIFGAPALPELQEPFPLPLKRVPDIWA